MTRSAAQPRAARRGGLRAPRRLPGALVRGRVAWLGGRARPRGAARGAASSSTASRPGDRVVVLMENSPDVGVAYDAIWRAGAVVTPAIFLLTRARGRAPRRRLRAGARPHLPRVRGHGARRGGRGAASSTTSRELEADEPAPIVAARRRRPRRARLHRRHDRPREGRDAHAREPLGGRPRADTRPGTSDGIDRSLTCLPLAHSYGLLVLGVGPAPPGPAGSVLMRWFDAGGWLGSAQEHRVQIAAGRPLDAPAAARAAARGVRPLRAALPRLRRGAAGAPRRSRSSSRRFPASRSARATGSPRRRRSSPTNPPGAARRRGTGRRRRCRAREVPARRRARSASARSS